MLGTLFYCKAHFKSFIFITIKLLFIRILLLLYYIITCHCFY
uniref:Uncharacterized protein n=1 Tax=Lepeophtheirus salmonis TaxID=72036 RepID=A0A0K2ULP7_LEPSM